MNQDALKLTTYFSERDRTDRGLLSDELLDVYARHGLNVSVLLRGAEGFGRLAQLHSDRLLSLSQDLPFVSIAVDTREQIERALESLLAIRRRGLVTLERARMLTGELGSVELPDRPLEAMKLTVFVGRGERIRGIPAFVAVSELFYRHGMAGATVLLGVDGTRHGQRTRARFLARNSDVPMMIVAVGAGERFAEVLPELGRLLVEPLMTLERVRVCKRDGTLLTAPHALPATDQQGLALWQKLMVYTSHAATRNGRPLHLEIIRQLRESDAAGATSVRGVWGFHGSDPPHGDRIFRLARRVPVVTVAIDTPERSIRSFEIIDALTTGAGLVTSEIVPALSAVSETARWGGLQLADHRL